ncbi:hypothetical protein EJ06DRAFT_552431 [Trichodelitschia bisporula]|uniref:Uncharacterized protein n=1 Tax=Trichodelitschia bisporula TaxID=703511 RepID=A0A6G1I9T7_9PEZI|nr:hypothetical protein EJ06DRAFT_552431 [Trichodelitschia bisporula]
MSHRSALPASRSGDAHSRSGDAATADSYVEDVSTSSDSSAAATDSSVQDTKRSARVAGLNDNLKAPKRLRTGGQPRVEDVVSTPAPLVSTDTVAQQTQLHRKTGSVTPVNGHDQGSASTPVDVEGIRPPFPSPTASAWERAGLPSIAKRKRMEDEGPHTPSPKRQRTRSRSPGAVEDPVRRVIKFNRFPYAWDTEIESDPRYDPQTPTPARRGERCPAPIGQRKARFWLPCLRGEQCWVERSPSRRIRSQLNQGAGEERDPFQPVPLATALGMAVELQNPFVSSYEERGGREETVERVPTSPTAVAESPPPIPIQEHGMSEETVESVSQSPSAESVLQSPSEWVSGSPSVVARSPPPAYMPGSPDLEVVRTPPPDYDFLSSPPPTYYEVFPPMWSPQAAVPAAARTPVGNFTFLVRRAQPGEGYMPDSPTAQTQSLSEWGLRSPSVYARRSPRIFTEEVESSEEYRLVSPIYRPLSPTFGAREASPVYMTDSPSIWVTGASPVYMPNSPNLGL